MTENEVAKQIVDAAYRMHTSLGPGPLESAYEAVLGIRVGKSEACARYGSRLFPYSIQAPGSRRDSGRT